MDVYALTCKTDISQYACDRSYMDEFVVVVIVVVILFYVHGKQLWSCRDSQLI